MRLRVEAVSSSLPVLALLCAHVLVLPTSAVVKQGYLPSAAIWERNNPEVEGNARPSPRGGEPTSAPSEAAGIWEQHNSEDSLAFPNGAQPALDPSSPPANVWKRVNYPKFGSSRRPRKTRGQQPFRPPDSLAHWERKGEYPDAKGDAEPAGVGGQPSNTPGYRMDPERFLDSPHRKGTGDNPETPGAPPPSPGVPPGDTVWRFVNHFSAGGRVEPAPRTHFRVRRGVVASAGGAEPEPSSSGGHVGGPLDPPAPAMEGGDPHTRGPHRLWWLTHAEGGSETLTRSTGGLPDTPSYPSGAAAWAQGEYVRGVVPAQGEHPRAAASGEGHYTQGAAQGVAQGAVPMQGSVLQGASGPMAPQGLAVQAAPAPDMGGAPQPEKDGDHLASSEEDDRPIPHALLDWVESFLLDSGDAHGSSPAPASSIMGPLMGIPSSGLPSARREWDPRLHVPDFFVVGQQKCGTSTLWSLLSRHPRVRHGPSKELFFFNSHCDGHVPRYLRLMNEEVPVPPGALLGDFTADRFSKACYPGLVHAINPDARIILLLRSPIQRSISRYYEQLALDHNELARTQRRNIMRGPPGFPSYSLALLQVIHTCVALGKPLAFCLEKENILGWSYYSPFLRMWLDKFGPRRVLVLYTEEMDRDALATVRLVEDFLGLTRHDYGLQLARTHFNTRGCYGWTSTVGGDCEQKADVKPAPMDSDKLVLLTTFFEPMLRDLQALADRGQIRRPPAGWGRYTGDGTQGDGGAG